jgi:hypothetical protein
MGGTDLHVPHLTPILEKYFVIESYNAESTYDKNTCVFVITHLQESVYQYLEQGFKLIVANLWEARPYILVGEVEKYLNNVLLMVGSKNPKNPGWKNMIGVERWFWYNESLWHINDNIFAEQQKYIPSRTNSKLFLMPICRQKSFRNKLRDYLTEFLPQSIFSYVEAFENPQQLPILKTPTINQLASWHRLFEPLWYNDTFFTIAVESAVDRLTDLDAERNGLRPEAYPCDTFITEKTYKPIANYHPFMVCGMSGILQVLKDSGFQTFDHIFDESYDQVELFEDKMKIIYNNIKNFNIDSYNNPLTAEIVLHNHNHFYNKEKISQGVYIDLIEPMLEFINET